MVHVPPHVAKGLVQLLNQTQLAYFMFRTAGALLPHMPPKLGYPLFSFLGDLIFRLNKGSRAVVLENLSHVLRGADEAALLAKVREVFRNALKNYYELFHHHSLSDKQIKGTLTVEGLEHVEKALSLGRGLILTSAHFGSPDALMQVAPLFSYRLTAPAEHVKPERLFQYLCRIRGRRGINLLPVDQPLLGLFRALKRNEIVAIATDRDITNSGIVVDFFGAPARLPDGYVQLSLRTGAPLIFGYGLRLGDSRYMARLEPPVELENSGDMVKDTRLGVVKVVHIMERVISAHPEQWMMFYPLWRLD